MKYSSENFLCRYPRIEFSLLVAVCHQLKWRFRERSPAFPARPPPLRTIHGWEELSNSGLTLGKYGQFELMRPSKHLRNCKSMHSYEADLLQLSDIFFVFVRRTFFHASFCTFSIRYTAIHSPPAILEECRYVINILRASRRGATHKWTPQRQVR